MTSANSPAFIFLEIFWCIVKVKCIRDCRLDSLTSGKCHLPPVSFYGRVVNMVGGEFEIGVIIIYCEICIWIY